MKTSNRSFGSTVLVGVLTFVCISIAAGRATADDADVLNKKFDELQAAIKAKDADKLWALLSAKSQADAEKIAKEMREAYAQASSEEKRKLEESIGLSAKEIPQLVGK